MAERRPLVAGLQPVGEDRAKEEAFVFGAAPREASKVETVPAATVPPHPTTAGAGRVPLTTRIRPELAASLKRLSLERQLAGISPSAIQDIVEESLELWLLKNSPFR